MTLTLVAEADHVADILAASRLGRKESSRSYSKQEGTANRLRQDKGKGKLRTTTDKLLFGIPRQSILYMMNLDGSDLETFVESGSKCPYLDGTAMEKEATAMMGRPAEYMAVDEINEMAFWGDWMGGSGSGENASFNASIFSSPLESPEIDPVVTCAYYRPPPGHPDGIEGCDGYANPRCTWSRAQ
jgi:hypothetical protein